MFEANWCNRWLSLKGRVISAPVVEAVESKPKAGGEPSLQPLTLQTTAWDTNTDGTESHKAGTDKKEATIAIEKPCA